MHRICAATKNIHICKILCAETNNIYFLHICKICAEYMIMNIFITLGSYRDSKKIGNVIKVLFALGAGG